MISAIRPEDEELDPHQGEHHRDQEQRVAMHEDAQDELLVEDRRVEDPAGRSDRSPTPPKM
jgi:hypothetical protein